VTLLFVPLIASAHHHAFDEAAPGSCAVCIVAHHAPVTIAPAVSALSLAWAPTALSDSPTAPLVHRAHSPISGRAPPPSFSAFSVS
jgi:hypothetical protein